MLQLAALHALSVTFRGGCFGVRALVATTAPQISHTYSPKFARIALAGNLLGGTLRGTAELVDPEPPATTPVLRLDPELDRQLKLRGVKVLTGGYSAASDCLWVEANVVVFGKISMILNRRPVLPEAREHKDDPEWA